MKMLIFRFLSFVSLILLCSCSTIVFHGTKKIVAYPSYLGFSYDELSIPVGADSSIKAWLIKSRNPKRLLIQFHGNSENRGGHFLQLAWLTEYQTDILIMDYRGFGDSSGVSGDREMREDVLATLNYAKTQLRIYDQVVLVGQSLGGHYLIQALEKSQDHYDLLILDSTFHEFPSMAMQKVFASSSFFLSDKKIHLPVKETLIIHGEKDPVIPVSLGKHLEKILEGKVTAWYPEEGKHLDTFYSHRLIYRQKLLDILNAGSWKAIEHKYSAREEKMLKAKYCSNDSSNDLIKENLNYLSENRNEIKAPADCEQACLCNFYADLFKSFGTRRLAQSMYRQNSLSDEEREKMCREKIKKLCP